jgi:hypothetical protein
MVHTWGCEICGRLEDPATHQAVERGHLCTRCMGFLDAGFQPPFKCEPCGGSEDLDLCNYGKSLVCRPCREGTMGIATDHVVRESR